MKRALTHPVVLWVVIVALVIWPLFRSSPKPLIDDKTRAEASALRASRARDSTTIDSLRRSAVSSQAATDRAVARARAVERVAAVEGRRADSLARSAAVSDPGPNPWKDAYAARTAERDSLLRSIAERDSADVKSHFTLTALTAALDSSEQRRQRLEDVNTRLLKAVEKAERGCRIAVLIPCPNRKQALVAGAAGGVIATLLAHR
ncbi:MAG TPA: hypothetical protein VL333_13200 [Candidatus Saccharimonadales bacterium]|jgi:hypothetical protein|nr:hypothetical protein [Candidatus Saccharimonadales bacterium]